MDPSPTVKRHRRRRRILERSQRDPPRTYNQPIESRLKIDRLAGIKSSLLVRVRNKLCVPHCIVLLILPVLFVISIPFPLPKIMMYPICEVKSLLFAKYPSTYTNSFRLEKSIEIYLIPRSILSICHCNLLLRVAISESVGSWCCATTERSHEASGWHIVAV